MGKFVWSRKEYGITRRIISSPTDSILISCGRTGIICHDSYSGKELWSVKHQRNASVASFTSDGKYVIVTVICRGIYIVNVATGEKIVEKNINVIWRYVNFDKVDKIYQSNKIVIQVRSNRIFYCNLYKPDTEFTRIDSEYFSGSRLIDNTDNHILIATTKTVNCLDFEQQNVIWEDSCGLEPKYLTVIPNDRVLIGNEQSITCRLVSNDCILWKIDHVGVKTRWPGWRNEIVNFCLSYDKTKLVVLFGSRMRKMWRIEIYNVHNGEKVWERPYNRYDIKWLSISPDNTKIIHSNGRYSSICDIISREVMEYNVRRMLYIQNGDYVRIDKGWFSIFTDKTLWSPLYHRTFSQKFKDVVITIMLLRYNPSCCLYLFPIEILFDIYQKIDDKISY